MVLSFLLFCARTLLTSSSDSLIIQGKTTEYCISFLESLPIELQYSFKREIFLFISSGEPKKRLYLSACFATTLSKYLSPDPPTIIVGYGFWIGFGLHIASFIL